MEWMQQAVCQQVDPDLFVNDYFANELKYTQRRAVKICQSCPVIDSCREYAFTLARETPIYGVWGGMTASEINKAARVNHQARSA